MRTGFARVRADEGVGRDVVTVEIFGNGTADREKSGVVERSSAGDATNAVRSKKLSRHRVKGGWAPADKKFSTATLEGHGGAWRMC